MGHNKVFVCKNCKKPLFVLVAKNHDEETEIEILCKSWDRTGGGKGVKCNTMNRVKI